MDYQKSSIIFNKQQTAVSNAHIYPSFAGDGPARGANGILPDAPTMWWDDERIEATVTRQFVLSKLRSDEQLRLDVPLGFGDGLTDDTYMEWIEQKVKKIFLILVDLGVPDQIFGLIDDSWDDDDLPIPFDQVERLRLTFTRDEKMERKFFHRQFAYLLRHVQRGEHMSYDEEEVVPLELADKRPVGAVTAFLHSNVDKVHLPGRPDDMFIRRRIPLGNAVGCMPQEDFLSGVEAMKVIQHDHLMSLWASYIHQDCGYLLLTPVNDSSLKSFLTVTPQSFKILAKQDRRVHVLNWLHCLADALSLLHGKGLSHGNIKPSTVMLDLDNHVFLAESAALPLFFQTEEKQGFDKESYDYCAPEEVQRLPTSPPPSITARPLSMRKSPGSPRAPSEPMLSPTTDSASLRTNSTSSHRTSYQGSPPKSTLTPLFSGRHDPQKSDIFSLGTIFLEILTFFLKRASRNFASHRSAKNKTPGRGGGLPDASFHKNHAQVESWMGILARDASKKEDKVFRGVAHMLAVIERMVSLNPDDRPSATTVQERIYLILTENCGLGAGQSVKDGGRGRVHCVHKQQEATDWTWGFEQMRLADQRAAAQACAQVAPVSPTSNGNSVIYGIERINSANSGYVTSASPRTNGRGKENDGMSIATRRSDRSSDGKSKASGGMNTGGRDKPKPKVKAWQAPVYAEFSFG